ncbi:monosaccharide ABC transporter ATP-binding protein, CUT2 family [Mycetocola miduiensis]|uniref:Monosaccharide ABC transporter ATP-binding protein, CUT2 family n=1 Tax=Mycetocola miduiensis TaxID=995034 RepID=A0A1I4ZIS4_9MICO|nr:monosaccharide ABC transporter ATP-binding protein, CUT2 family [Mycetocola miduiensis]
MLLRAEGLTKVFPGVIALNDITIDVAEGEVHCIVGENGAGKSTLIKCLTGVYKPEKGRIEVSGEATTEGGVQFAAVAYVPQEIDLFMQMSVMENLFMPFERTGVTTPISYRALEERARPIIEEYGIKATPRTLVSELSVADQQLVQIARAVQHEDAKILILDEPTSSLTDDDATRVFQVVRRAKARGMGVIYISHKLDELAVIGDRVTVFRNGRSVASDYIENVDIDWLIREMTGRKLAWEQSFVPNSGDGDVVLDVRSASGPGFQDVSFQLRAGEILGFSGLVGAGRTELMLSIYGTTPLYAGEITVHGADGERAGGRSSRRKRSPEMSLKEGLAYLPEDRKRLGIFGGLSVAANTSMMSLSGFVRGGTIRQGTEKQAVLEEVKRYDVRFPTIDTAIRLLSGGNQQKVIIARTMMVTPRIVIFDEPTKGIDVGAKYEIYDLMRRLAEEQGLGVILVSSELDEIVYCSNRAIVMNQGRVVSEFDQPLNKEALVSAMFGHRDPIGNVNE